MTRKAVHKAISIKDKQFFEQLELGEVLQALARLCHCDPARALLDVVVMHRSADHVRQFQQDIFEMKALLEEEDDWVIPSYHDISPIMPNLKVNGYVLDHEDLVMIRDGLMSVQKVGQFFKVEKEKEYKRVRQYYEGFDAVDDLLKAYDKVFDRSNNVRDNASPLLMRISSQIGHLRAKASSTFLRLKKRYAKENYLTDSEESLRNGRRVFSIPVEHKRKVPGIIHDYSSTGKTAFIEPQELVAIQNDIQEKQYERKQEIRRIRLKLCDTLRPYTTDIEESVSSLAHLDLLQAKARLAIEFDAHPVKIEDRMGLEIVQGRHPILLLKYKAKDREVVPFDLSLNHKQRILILSGPNAGGKTVTMKAIGVIQTMVQCGLPVPVAKGSKTSVFKRIFTDIGDRQSIDNELSTYSSKIKSLRYFLSKAGGKTLLLLDEFGSGTDPSLGGAIAEAILEELDRRRTYVVATTHYPNLKVLAQKRKSMVNGAMTFDKEKLIPSFSLVVGQPGNSYAFEISKRMGIDHKLLKRAEKIAGKGHVSLEDILKSMQAQKTDLKKKLEAVESEKNRLNQLVKTYESLQSELDYRRKKMKLEAKELEVQLRQKIDREIEELRSQSEKQAALKAIKAKKKAKDEKLRKEQAQIKEELFKRERHQRKKPIKVGSHVKIRDGALSGTVEEMKGDRVWINSGVLRVEVDLRELVTTEEPIDTNGGKSITVQSKSHTQSLRDKIDLRGMTVSESNRLLESYLDRAIMEKLTGFTIVHGKGTGALRKAIWKLLAAYPVDLSYKHPSDEQGGQGITLVSLI